MRLKTSQISETRAELLAQQNNLCPLCARECDSPVLDHAHGAQRGWIRSTLCRACNLFLGKLEQHKRYKVTDLSSFLRNAAQYVDLHSTNQTGLFHPTHRSPDEKKALAKKRKAKKIKSDRRISD